MTGPDFAGGYVTEEWAATQRTSKSAVNVTGADAAVETEHRHAMPGSRIQTWPLSSVEIVWSWRDDGDTLGDPFVTLRTRGRDGRPDGGKMFLEQLWRVPAWLADLIERSRPRV